MKHNQMAEHNKVGSASPRRGFSRLKTLLVGSVGVLCCAFLWPAVAQVAPEGAAPPEPLTDVQLAQRCQSNLKQIGLATLMYCQDYDEKMPLASVRGPQNGDDEVTPVGWVDGLLPYIKSTSVFQCPAEAHPSSVTRAKNGNLNDAAQLSGFTDYWYNANLSGISLSQIEEPYKTITFGEGDGGAINSNARYSLDSLPVRWLKNPKSPSYRHNEGTTGNYAFAEGHVAPLTPDKVVDKAPGQLKAGEATFDEGFTAPIAP